MKENRMTVLEGLYKELKWKESWHNNETRGLFWETISIYQSIEFACGKRIFLHPTELDSCEKYGYYVGFLIEYCRELDNDFCGESLKKIHDFLMDYYVKKYGYPTNEIKLSEILYKYKEICSQYNVSPKNFYIENDFEYIKGNNIGWYFTKKEEVESSRKVKIEYYKGYINIDGRDYSVSFLPSFIVKPAIDIIEGHLRELLEEY